MSFSTVINIVTMIFCLAVTIQSFRMMKSLSRVQDGDLKQMVAALDTSTAKARAVVAELKQTLAADASTASRTLSESKAIHEELSVMIGIANAMAERLMDAASTQAPATPVAADVAPKPKRAAPKTKTPAKKPAAKKSAAPKAKAPVAKKPAAGRAKKAAPAPKPELGKPVLVAVSEVA